MYTLETEDKQARAGILTTAHGEVETPFFMPLATKGAFKHLTSHEIEKQGYRAVMSNAFLLNLKPGLDVIKQHDGLHQFMKWKNTIFTDSGGYQMILPSFIIKTTNDGIWFKNPFDGSTIHATPEMICDVQQQLGSDVAMVLDCQPKHGDTKEQVIDALNKTHTWAERFLKAHTKKNQLVFGIAQGGSHEDLRAKSTAFINSLPVDGVAIGGLGIGEGSTAFKTAVAASIPHISKNKPRYVMGVGSPLDILEAISLGVDIFDSCFPTRNARHNELYTNTGKINIEKKNNHDNNNPLDTTCTCYTCTHHTKSYLHHLAKTKEITGQRLNTIHNLHFLKTLMHNTRLAIKEQQFEQFKKEFIKNFAHTTAF